MKANALMEANATRTGPKINMAASANGAAAAKRNHPIATSSFTRLDAEKAAAHNKYSVQANAQTDSLVA